MDSIQIVVALVPLLAAKIVAAISVAAHKRIAPRNDKILVWLQSWFSWCAKGLQAAYHWYAAEKPAPELEKPQSAAEASRELVQWTRDHSTQDMRILGVERGIQEWWASERDWADEPTAIDFEAALESDPAWIPGRRPTVRWIPDCTACTWVREKEDGVRLENRCIRHSESKPELIKPLYRMPVPSDELLQTLIWKVQEQDQELLDRAIAGWNAELEKATQALNRQGSRRDFHPGGPV